VCQPESRTQSLHDMLALGSGDSVMSATWSCVSVGSPGVWRQLCWPKSRVAVCWKRAVPQCDTIIAGVTPAACASSRRCFYLEGYRGLCVRVPLSECGSAAQCHNPCVKPGGLVSSHMHTAMRPGMTLSFRGVGGTFTPVPEARAPALLIAGGIGKCTSSGPLGCTCVMH
jgi:hypothetical protein